MRLTPANMKSHTSAITYPPAPATAQTIARSHILQSHRQYHAHAHSHTSTAFAPPRTLSPHRPSPAHPSPVTCDHSSSPLAHVPLQTLSSVSLSSLSLSSLSSLSLSPLSTAVRNQGAWLQTPLRLCKGVVLSVPRPCPISYTSTAFAPPPTLGALLQAHRPLAYLNLPPCSPSPSALTDGIADTVLGSAAAKSIRVMRIAAICRFSGNEEC